MRKITVLDFANQIGVLSDEVPVVVKTDRKVIGRFRCLYEIPETAMPGFLKQKSTMSFCAPTRLQFRSS